MRSPPTCPYSVTVRRNPHRKARPTPATNAPSVANSSSNLQDIPSFPINDILSIEIPQQNPQPNPVSENLKVFLRIRPVKPLQCLRKLGKNGDQVSKNHSKNAWPKNPLAKNTLKETNSKKTDVSIVVNESTSVTLFPPLAMQDSKRIKSEVYEGFSHVFSAESSQEEVYEKMVNPLVEDFLRGKSGMLAALGPSGSGKTHTVFGCPREPGMVPLILRQIFKQNEGSNSEQLGAFYITIFEIYSEKGKGERILDLSPEGGDVSMQQSTIKGLQELLISDVAEAESLIARGMLKRATAVTKANSQSSRSQCIINIRCAPGMFDAGAADVLSRSSVLTIVDLAGAEREKRTGNQGTRLLESNFINNTSMVFGLCLRSLLEHQKNPKKPFQKHYQNSLLTRYLRDYLEGKKRMALILTVKSGEEDYLDTSFLLRQASPYMKIKFNSVKEPSDNKRKFQTFPRLELLKKVKTEEGKGSETEHQLSEEVPAEKDAKLVNVLIQSSNNSRMNADEKVPRLEYDLAKTQRNSQIMQNFARALWNVLKEYKSKVEVAENEVYKLRESIRIEKTRNFELEKELNDLRPCCSCAGRMSKDGPHIVINTNAEARDYSSPEQDGHASNNLHESDVDTPSSNLNASPYVGPLRDWVSPTGLDQDINLQLGSSDVIYPNHSCIKDLKLHNEQVAVEASSIILTELDCDDDERKSEATVQSSDVVAVLGLPAKNCNEQNNQVGDRDFSMMGSRCDDNEQNSGATERSSLVDNASSLCIENFNKHDQSVNQKHETCRGAFEDTLDLGTKENCPCTEESGSRLSEFLGSSFRSAKVRDDSPSSVQVDQPNSVQDKIILDPSLSSEADEAFPQDCNEGNVRQNEDDQASFLKHKGVEKPKRRLLPASSILLRDMSNLNHTDENERLKGTGGERRQVADDRNMTQGSISLMRLLKSNFNP